MTCELRHRSAKKRRSDRLRPVPATPFAPSFRSLGKHALQPAGRKMTPSNVSPVVTKRQSPMSSLRASATIIVLRVPARLSAVRA